MLSRSVCRGSWILCMAICLWAAPLPAGQISDDLNAFNGYILETPISAYASFHLVDVWSTEFVQEVALYEKPGDSIDLNGAVVKKVRYRFADGRLESIQLTYEGYDNRQKLIGWLEEHYGK